MPGCNLEVVAAKIDPKLILTPRVTTVPWKLPIQGSSEPAWKKKGK